MNDFIETARGDETASIAFSMGTVRAREVIATSDDDPRPPGNPQHTVIGVNRPISIEILSTYTGKVPGWGRKDILAVSGTKSVQTYNASARGVNQIFENADEKTLFQPAAFANGSAIVFYKKALTDDTVHTSYELVSDTFPGEVFDQIGDAFASAAGLPIFAPASQYLLAGSVVVKMLKELGDALVESVPYLTAKHTLRFDTPGFPMSLARNLAYYNDSDMREFAPYNVKVDVSGQQPRAILAHKETGAEYNGYAPYIVVSIDGRERLNLDGFEATAATSALLDRFYRSTNTATSIMSVMETGLKLYNDLQYSEKAKGVKARMSELEPDSDEYKKLKASFDAYNKNIQTDEFKVIL